MAQFLSCTPEERTARLCEKDTQPAERSVTVPPTAGNSPTTQQKLWINLLSLTQMADKHILYLGYLSQSFHV